jgi:hypothetical protein
LEGNYYGNMRLRVHDAAYGAAPGAACGAAARGAAARGAAARGAAARGAAARGAVRGVARVTLNSFCINYLNNNCSYFVALWV